MVSAYRVGLVVPSSNTTMETELPALLRSRERSAPGERFTFHSARARMRRVTPDELAGMNAEVERASAQLADAAPDVVATACLVAIMSQGRGYHRTAEADIARVLEQERAPAPVVSSAGALIAALSALGARRIAMVTPYVASLTCLVADYIEDAGIVVQDSVSLEVSDNREVAALDPGDLPRHVRTLDLDGCDALVLSACVQMPSLPVLEQVEQEVELPVLSAATATAWAVLTALGVEPSVPGGGELLRGRITAAR